MKKSDICNLQKHQKIPNKIPMLSPFGSSLEITKDSKHLFTHIIALLPWVLPVYGGKLCDIFPSPPTQHFCHVKVLKAIEVWSKSQQFLLWSKTSSIPECFAHLPFSFVISIKPLIYIYYVQVNNCKSLYIDKYVCTIFRIQTIWSPRWTSGPKPLGKRGQWEVLLRRCRAIHKMDSGWNIMRQTTKMR